MALFSDRRTQTLHDVPTSAPPRSRNFGDDIASHGLDSQVSSLSGWASAAHSARTGMVQPPSGPRAGMGGPSGAQNILPSGSFSPTMPMSGAQTILPGKPKTNLPAGNQPGWLGRKMKSGPSFVDRVANRAMKIKPIGRV